LQIILGIKNDWALYLHSIVHDGKSVCLLSGGKLIFKFLLNKFHISKC